MDPISMMIPGAIKGGLGLYQMIRGGLMKPKRPTYEIPTTATEELGTARMEAAGRMPGINYAQQRIDQTSASSAYRLNRAATTPGQILAGAAGIQANANVAERGLLEAESGDHYRRLNNLRTSLRMFSSYKDKEFDINKMQPYQDKARTKAALIQGGLLNFAGGANDAIQGKFAGDFMQGLAGNPSAGATGATGEQMPLWMQMMQYGQQGSQYMRRDVNRLPQLGLNPF